MSSPLENAQDSLSIKFVSLQKSTIFLNEDFINTDLTKISSETQTYRGNTKVLESSFEYDDDVSWEYCFLYSIGVRLVEVGEESSEDVSQDPEDDITPIIEITATFNAKHLSPTKLSDEVLKAFSENNVGYNVWPYWREFAQSSTSRLNVPTFEIPFYFCNSKK